MLTTIFGIYALALLVSLLVVGGLSDHVGRRPVLVVAFLLEAASMVLFLVSDGVGWLLAARIVQGLATGALTSALGAAVLDLQRPERPWARSSTAPPPGSGCRSAPWVRGCWSQFVPSPTTGSSPSSPWCSCSRRSARCSSCPRRPPALPGTLASLRPRVHVPPANRPPFLAALPILVACWAVGGFYASLGPSLLVDVFGIDNHLAGGLLIFALNGTGVLGSLALREGRAPSGLWWWGR